MADLEVPRTSDDLSLARSDEGNVYRPLLTGDVIDGVVVPILGADPMMVAVLGHPCAMRSGPTLSPMIHVAPVTPMADKAETVWRSHFKVMPLPELRVSPPAHKIDLSAMTLTPSADLALDLRIACLSRYGINLLRQRLVHHLTRVVVDTATFDQEAAATHEEVDLMEDWVTEASICGIDPALAADSFHKWIRSNSRQSRLGDPQTASTVRAECVKAIRELAITPTTETIEPQ